MNADRTTCRLNHQKSKVIRRFQRWGQPAQQQGRRMPLRILSSPTLMRWRLVSSFLADVTQQIHSLRASGVISAHTSVTIGSDPIASRKSAGILCIIARLLLAKIIGCGTVKLSRQTDWTNPSLWRTLRSQSDRYGNSWPLKYP
jgi:hypothetical protein